MASMVAVVEAEMEIRRADRSTLALRLGRPAIIFPHRGPRPTPPFEASFIASACLGV